MSEATALRVEGCEVQLSQAKGRKSTTDVEVAQSIAHVVKTLLPNVATVCTFAAPPEGEPAMSERPVLLARQHGPTERRASGAVGGVVSLTYFRSPGEKPLTVLMLREAADALKVNMGVGMVREGSERDDTRVTVTSAPVAVPIIETLDPHAAGSFAYRLASQVARDYGIGSEGLSYGSAFAPYIESTHLVSLVMGSEVQSAEVDDDGVRRTVVSGVIAARVKTELRRSVEFRDEIDQTAESMAGTFVGGVGTVESVEWGTSSPELGDKATDAVTKATGLREHRHAENRSGMAFGLPFRAVLVSSAGTVNTTDDTEENAA